MYVFKEICMVFVIELLVIFEVYSIICYSISYMYYLFK